MLIGFYFARMVGTLSPLFIVDDIQTHDFFTAHFHHIFEKAKKLLVYSSAVKEFHSLYYEQCMASLLTQGQDH